MTDSFAHSQGHNLAFESPGDLEPRSPSNNLYGPKLVLDMQRTSFLVKEVSSLLLGLQEHLLRTWTLLETLRHRGLKTVRTDNWSSGVG